MNIPRNMQDELEKRDEIIMAMEMLMVDQACRLLALEAIVVNIEEVRNIDSGAVKARIAQESKRFRQHFEGEGMSGFVERAQRIAKDLVSSSKDGRVPKKTAKGVAKSSIAKRSKTSKPLKK